MPRFALGALLVLGLFAFALKGFAPKSARTSAHAPWLVSEEGVGPVRIGQPRAEASAALGTPIGGALAPLACLYHTWAGAPVGLYLSITNQIETVVVNSGDIRTDKGVGIGDEGQRVIDAYTGGDYKVTSTPGPYPAISVRSTRVYDLPRGLKFHLDSTNHVTGFEAGYWSGLTNQICTVQ